ncbi:MAG: hypothetical protein AAF617_00595 [Bacteroidota bacterium]
MNKKSLQNLALHKSTISRLEKAENIKGGIGNTWLSWLFTDCQQEPTPETVFPACNSRLAACPM